MVISWHFQIISLFLIRISCKTYNILDIYFFGKDIYHVMLTKKSWFLTLMIIIVAIIKNQWSITSKNFVFSFSLGYLFLFLFLMLIAMMINVDHDQWSLIKDNDYEIMYFSHVNLVKSWFYTFIFVNELNLEWLLRRGKVLIKISMTVSLNDNLYL